jgi:hypothetical protein
MHYTINKKLYAVALSVFIIITGFFVGHVIRSDGFQNVIASNSTLANTYNLNENIRPSVIGGDKNNLVFFSILPGSKVSGVISYKGSVKGGYFFEGNILINILNVDKKILKNSNAMATSEWMTADPVEFEGNLDFSYLPKGPAYIEIHNDNASGLPENDKSILIPIIIE